MQEELIWIYTGLKARYLYASPNVGVRNSSCRNSPRLGVAPPICPVCSLEEREPKGHNCRNRLIMGPRVLALGEYPR